MGHLQERKIAKRIWSGLAVLLLVGVCVCMLVNYIVSREITWSLYSAGGAALALGIATSLTFGGKHRLLLTIAILAMLIMPFLMLVERLSSMSAWAWPVGFPIAAVSVLALLVITILFRYTHINRWYCTSVAVLTTLPIRLTANRAVAVYLNESRGAWQIVSDVANVAIICALAVYLVVLGRQKKKNEARNKENAVSVG